MVITYAFSFGSETTATPSSSFLDSGQMYFTTDMRPSVPPLKTCVYTPLFGS